MLLTYNGEWHHEQYGCTPYRLTVLLSIVAVLDVYFNVANNCLSNAIHRMGQNIKSRRVSVCVCARDFGVEYLENVKR